MAGHESGPKPTHIEQPFLRVAEGIAGGLIAAFFGWLMFFFPESQQFGEQEPTGH